MEENITKLNEINYIYKNNLFQTEYNFKLLQLENEDLILKLEYLKDIEKDYKLLIIDNDKLKIDFISQNNKINSFLEEIKELKQNLKIIKIENKELNEILDINKEKQEQDNFNFNNIKLKLKEKENIINNLQKQIKEIEKESSDYFSLSYKNKSKDNKNFISNISTIYSSNLLTNNNLNKEYINTLNKDDLNNENYLLLNDFLQDDENETLSLNLTPLKEIKKMSMKDKNSNNNHLEDPIDIYKDFFKLTFQALKLNTFDNKKLILFNSLNIDLIYENIKEEKVPFHKVKLLNLIFSFPIILMKG